MSFAAEVDVTDASNGEAPVRVGRPRVDPTGTANSSACDVRPSLEFCGHSDLPHGSWPEVGTGATNLPDRLERAFFKMDSVCIKSEIQIPTVSCVLPK